MPHHHAEAWTLPVGLTLTMVGIALVYLFRSRQLPAWRRSAFLVGAFIVWLAVASPLGTLDHQLLTFHMVKHLLLMTVAAPFILFGILPLAPLTPTRWSPLALSLCWLAGTATVIGWHIPPAFELALRSPAWHHVENASFLVAGLLFWWPLAQPRTQGWAAPVYLFLATMPCDILSAFLVFCGRVVYPSYLGTPGKFGLSALDDQELAGALMWVAITFIYLVPSVLLTVRILSPRVPQRELQVSS